jgi:uncharacterized membrane protein YoaK (UPF0700 family)
VERAVNNRAYNTLMPLAMLVCAIAGIIGAASFIAEIVMR